MKVVIIGKGTGWQDAPKLSEEYDTWGITQLILRREVDLVIDMNVYIDGRWGDKELNEANIARSLCCVKNLEYIDLDTYPLEEVIGEFDTDYFGNTVDYAVALALYKGYDSIDMYGVNMETESEYFYQKPSLDFWCGVAKGRGVTLRIFGERSSLMRTKDKKLYGYDRLQKINKEKGMVFI